VNILVTGGAGFIGSHLVDALLALGHRVTVLDNVSTGQLKNVSPSCQLKVGDIRDAACVKRCVLGQEVIFHLAAFTSVPGSLENPELCRDVNVNGTQNLLEAACSEGAGRFIFASTSALYPEYPDLPRSEATPLEPKSPYAQSKLEGERLLKWYGQSKGLSYLGLRYFNVYGPRQSAESDYAAVIPSFIAAQQRQDALQIFGDGRQTRDFVYVADVVRANLLAMESGICGIFNVGTSRPVSILCLAKTVIRLGAPKVPYTFSDPRPGDLMSSTADISNISVKLGWTPQWDLTAGLRETIRWFDGQLSRSEI
jgi:UDP-glucose 4-epimerase